MIIYRMNSKEKTVQYRNRAEREKNQRLNDRMFNITNNYTRPSQMLDHRFMINSRSQKNKPQQVLINQDDYNDITNVDRIAFNTTNNDKRLNLEKINNMHFAEYTKYNSTRNREQIVHQRPVPMLTERQKIFNSSNDFQFDNVHNNTVPQYKERIQEDNSNVYKNMSFDKFDPTIKY